jgi:hypothetical protein
VPRVSVSRAITLTTLECPLAKKDVNAEAVKEPQGAFLRANVRDP